MNLKPFAVFIEYTIRPLLDDFYELLLKMEKYNVNYKPILKKLVLLYLIERFLNAFSAIICTLIICTTLILILYFFPSLRTW